MELRVATHVGKAAPALELPDSAGKLTSVQSLQGKPVLVSFLSHAA